MIFINLLNVASSAAALYIPAVFLAAANFRVPISIDIAVTAGGVIDFIIAIVYSTWKYGFYGYLPISLITRSLNR